MEPDQELWPARDPGKFRASMPNPPVSNPNIVSFAESIDHLRLRLHIMMVYEPHLPGFGIITDSRAIHKFAGWGYWALTRLCLFVLIFIIVLRFMGAVEHIGRRLRQTIHTR